MIVIGVICLLVAYLVPQAPRQVLVPLGWIFVAVGLVLLLVYRPVY